MQYNVKVCLVGIPDSKVLKAITKSRCGVIDPVPLQNEIAAYKERSRWKRKLGQSKLVELTFS